MGKKLVLFGAGRIGRSFVGQIFSGGGYEVVFIDVSQPLIDEINLRGNYNVCIKGDVESVINVAGVRGIFIGNFDEAADEIAGADFVATSVGQGGLPGIFPVLAAGLLKRRESQPAWPLDILIAENLRNAAVYFRSALRKLLPSSFPLNEYVGLVETSIGKMVPIMTEKDRLEDPLQVFAEAYNTLILEERAFKNPLPEVKELAPKKNMKAWVDRKLFIHNLGHAAAAYVGYTYHSSFKYVHDALEVTSIKDRVRTVMLQAADALLKKYPDEFTLRDLTGHIDDLLYRFQNRALGDTIFRVGCDLFRKLGPDDRLAGAIRLSIETGMPYDKILEVLVHACHFRAGDENGNLFPEDVRFAEQYGREIRKVLTEVCGFNENTDRDVISQAERLEIKLL